MVGPAISVGLDVMAAAMIAAIDQHVTDAGCAHLAEGDFGRVRGPGFSIACNGPPVHALRVC